MTLARSARTVVAALVTTAAAGAATAAATATADYVLVLRDHRFEPATVEVPAGREITLLVRNSDPTPEEFESHDLGREKLIAPGGEVLIRIGPLRPGSFTFVGEFHEDTARGVVVAR